MISQSTCLSISILLGTIAQPVIAFPVYTDGNNQDHFCYMEEPGGEVIPLDEICGDRDYNPSGTETSANIFTPLTPGEQQSLIDLYNQTYCKTTTQADLTARGDRTILSPSNQESIQRNWATMITRQRVSVLPKEKRSGDLFSEQISPFVYQGLSQCP